MSAWGRPLKGGLLVNVERVMGSFGIPRYHFNSREINGHAAALLRRAGMPLLKPGQKMKIRIRVEVE